MSNFHKEFRVEVSKYLKLLLPHVDFEGEDKLIRDVAEFLIAKFMKIHENDWNTEEKMNEIGRFVGDNYEEFHYKIIHLLRFSTLEEVHIFNRTCRNFTFHQGSNIFLRGVTSPTDEVENLYYTIAESVGDVVDASISRRITSNCKYLHPEQSRYAMSQKQGPFELVKVSKLQNRQHINKTRTEEGIYRVEPGISFEYYPNKNDVNNKIICLPLHPSFKFRFLDIGEGYAVSINPRHTLHKNNFILLVYYKGKLICRTNAMEMYLSGSGYLKFFRSNTNNLVSFVVLFYKGKRVFEKRRDGTEIPRIQQVFEHREKDETYFFGDLYIHNGEIEFFKGQFFKSDVMHSVKVGEGNLDIPPPPAQERRAGIEGRITHENICGMIEKVFQESVLWDRKSKKIRLVLDDIEVCKSVLALLMDMGRMDQLGDLSLCVGNMQRRVFFFDLLTHPTVPWEDFSRTYQKFVILLHCMNNHEECEFSRIPKDVVAHKIIPYLSEFDIVQVGMKDVIEVLEMYYYQLLEDVEMVTAIIPPLEEFHFNNLLNFSEPWKVWKALRTIRKHIAEERKERSVFGIDSQELANEDDSSTVCFDEVIFQEPKFDIMLNNFLIPNGVKNVTHLLCILLEEFFKKNQIEDYINKNLREELFRFLSECLCNVVKPQTQAVESQRVHGRFDESNWNIWDARNENNEIERRLSYSLKSMRKSMRIENSLEDISQLFFILSFILTEKSKTHIQSLLLTSSYSHVNFTPSLVSNIFELIVLKDISFNEPTLAAPTLIIGGKEKGKGGLIQFAEEKLIRMDLINMFFENDYYIDQKKMIYSGLQIDRVLPFFEEFLVLYVNLDDLREDREDCGPSSSTSVTIRRVRGCISSLRKIFFSFGMVTSMHKGRQHVTSWILQIITSLLEKEDEGGKSNPFVDLIFPDSISSEEIPPGYMFIQSEIPAWGTGVSFSATGVLTDDIPDWGPTCPDYTIFCNYVSVLKRHLPDKRFIPAIAPIFGTFSLIMNLDVLPHALQFLKDLHKISESLKSSFNLLQPRRIRREDWAGENFLKKWGTKKCNFHPCSAEFIKSQFLEKLLDVFVLEERVSNTTWGVFQESALDLDPWGRVAPEKESVLKKQLPSTFSMVIRTIIILLTCYDSTGTAETINSQKEENKIDIPLGDDFCNHLLSRLVLMIQLISRISITNTLSGCLDCCESVILSHHLYQLLAHHIENETQECAILLGNSDPKQILHFYQESGVEVLPKEELVVDSENYSSALNYRESVDLGSNSTQKIEKLITLMENSIDILETNTKKKEGEIIWNPHCLYKVLLLFEYLFDEEKKSEGKSFRNEFLETPEFVDRLSRQILRIFSFVDEKVMSKSQMKELLDFYKKHMLSRINPKDLAWFRQAAVEVLGKSRNFEIVWEFLPVVLSLSTDHPYFSCPALLCSYLQFLANNVLNKSDYFGQVNSLHQIETTNFCKVGQPIVTLFFMQDLDDQKKSVDPLLSQILEGIGEFPFYEKLISKFTSNESFLNTVISLDWAVKLANVMIELFFNKLQPTTNMIVLDGCLGTLKEIFTNSNREEFFTGTISWEFVYSVLKLFSLESIETQIIAVELTNIFLLRRSDVFMSQTSHGVDKMEFLFQSTTDLLFSLILERSLSSIPSTMLERILLEIQYLICGILDKFQEEERLEELLDGNHFTGFMINVIEMPRTPSGSEDVYYKISGLVVRKIKEKLEDFGVNDYIDDDLKLFPRRILFPNIEEKETEISTEEIMTGSVGHTFSASTALNSHTNEVSSGNNFQFPEISFEEDDTSNIASNFSIGGNEKKRDGERKKKEGKFPEFSFEEDDTSNAWDFSNEGNDAEKDDPDGEECEEEGKIEKKEDDDIFFF